MSFEPRDYSIHLVGLGGAGANIVEEFLRHPKTFDFLKRSGVKLSCLALDVADHDVLSLQKAHERFIHQMKSRGIPSEKVSFIAKSVKFPTPEAMFEFLGKFPEYLKLEGARVALDYSPWLTSSMEIPPLSGGCGRRRALAKGIYALNYYYLKLIDRYAEAFKESVSSSTLQPIVFMVFGIGGGSGSGMVVDFARHLRHKLGSGFPIIGLGILPCQGDDPPAKGTSALATLQELELLLDRSKNEVVKRVYGQVYENPFTAFLMMPLGPPYSKAGNLLDAKRIIDEAVVDILLNAMRFDLSDLLNNIGSNLDLGDRWIHTITSLRISYPIDEHVALVKLYLDRLDKMRAIVKERLETTVGGIDSGRGGLESIFRMIHAELSGIYKQLLIQRGVYEEKNFEDAIRNYIYEDPTIDLTFNMQLKGAEESILQLLNEVYTPTTTIGLGAVEGTPEARIRKLLSEIVVATKNIETSHATYSNLTSRIIDDMNTSIRSAHRLTFREKLLLNGFMDFVKLVDGYIRILRRYLENKTLADRLVRDLAKAEKTETNQRALSTVQRIVNPELTFIFSLLPALISVPSAELKAVDSHLSDIRIVRRDLAEWVEEAKVGRETLETRMKSLENERNSLRSETGRIRVPLLRSGKKAFLREKIGEIEHELTLVRAELEEVKANVGRIESKINEYLIVEKRFDVNSDYRKLLGDVNDLYNQFYEKLNQVSKDRGYYERVAEVTEDERLKIMQRILREEEATLTRENILKEIVDRRRFKEHLVAVMRILRIPSTLGLASDYRTDYMWVTVVVPRGIWDHDLDSELKTTLSGYISGDASRCIIIREIDSVDPWTIRFLIIASKASPENLDNFIDMKTLYEKSSKGEVTLAHSFLLEQGVIATKELVK